jgi:hypothetical protein
MNSADWNTLLSLLEARDWKWSDETLYAPRETMWLMREPWADPVQVFFERMEGRLTRIQRNLAAAGEADREQVANALSDVAILVDVLRDLTRRSDGL